MPIISGLETIEKIKQLFNEQNEVSPLVILHTSSEEHDVINSFRKEETSYFLLKPIKSEELYKTLRRAVKSAEIGLAATKSMPQEEHFPLMTSPNVLLVDDNPVNMFGGSGATFAGLDEAFSTFGDMLNVPADEAGMVDCFSSIPVAGDYSGSYDDLVPWTRAMG
jgi:CheY-like chemotaxis protein